MNWKKNEIKAPFFEIGPKSYLYGDEVLQLALAADRVAQKYDVDIIFTCPFVELRRVVEFTNHLHVFAPHMDPIEPGRGVADILPEAIKSAGACGVMLNHCEKPLTLSVLRRSIERAKDVGLLTIVCADSILEAKAVAMLEPTIIIAEPTELIGTGHTSDLSYIQTVTAAVKRVNPDVKVLIGAGISNGDDVYRVIKAGADATGSSSGIVKAADHESMIDEMILSLKKGWDEHNSGL